MTPVRNWFNEFYARDTSKKIRAVKPVSYTHLAVYKRQLLGSDEKFARLMEEADKYIGFPYVWGGSTPHTSFDCIGFVSYVLTNSGLYNTGRLGAQGLYTVSYTHLLAWAIPSSCVLRFSKREALQNPYSARIKGCLLYTSRCV